MLCVCVYVQVCVCVTHTKTCSRPFHVLLFAVDSGGSFRFARDLNVYIYKLGLVPAVMDVFV